MPTLNQKKRMPISLIVGDSLYAMDTFPRPSDAKCFEAFTHGPASSNLFSTLDWHWHSLPPLPYVFEPGYELPNSYIRSYTVVRHSDILVSAKDIGTYSFDIVSRAWSKIGDWVLPFSGRAEYIPEYDLWFGLSSYDDNNLLCTSDLSAASELKPPMLRHIWEDNLKPPQDWVRGLAYAVHLGSGKFCIARFFETPEEDPCEGGSGFIHWGCERFVVLIGVEVERCGEDGGGIRMITHRSKRYRLPNSKLPALVL
ncbi:uncharacterized protein LOC120698098 [Panicum virgatum]|uniref:Uncharacterized protein n=1 Tax=Panicum virgatum TaxID=38727 RepID=A0A8T0UPG0_PANVG|nr:uncharacterized protein LOC120698098 [Panicum virgatum]KAG2626322.1 hypothetical protein PVAP13_3KG348000 [Panicum virgatum]